MSRIIGLLVAAVVASVGQPSRADDDPFAEDAEAAGPVVKRALIVCGLPGDADHRKLFAETVEKLYRGLTAAHGFSSQNTIVLFSDAATEKDGPALAANRGPATRERLAETVAELEQAIQPGDALWVFVLGHAHHDGRSSWLNLPGPDMNQIEFGKLFAPIRCRQQAFFITTPVSGYFIKPLSAAGRIVITATEPDVEVNETIFPHKLASALADPPTLADLDIDGDGRPTLFDVHVWSARETAQEYATGELLATEHAMLDDDGDGRGTEVQLDYLSEELGGRLRAGRTRPAPRPGDGALARTIFVPVGTAEPNKPPAAVEDPTR